MKVAVGLSGGVDSSLTAHLLKEAGHEVTGVFLQCWRAPGCRAEEDRKDALQVALDLKIPFVALNFIDAYKSQVVEQFFKDYERGLTPNPDIWCNTAIKFGLFYDWALAEGYDAVATGHYARIGEYQSPKIAEKSILAPKRGVDFKKDQSYFLFRTRQEQLEHILFPLGEMTKEQVRQEASRRNIHVADKPDSQGICFIGDINVHDFLRERLGEKPGDVLDTEGNFIGKHQGVWFYTIGQRHGFELLPKVRTQKKEWKDVIPPLYVIDKNADNNTIVVGYGAQTLRSEMPLHDVFWRHESFRPPVADPALVMARVRHGGQLLPATFEWVNSDKNQARIKFDTPQRGLAAGQSVVFYAADQDDVCLGGATMG